MNNIYLDTETTGFKPGQIAELTMIEENEDNPGRVISVYNYFFTVDKMPEDAQKVHGLSLDMLKDLSNGERFCDRAVEIFDILSGKRIIAHNLKFDSSFLTQELLNCGIDFKVGACLDTMHYFKDICKLFSPRVKGYKNPKLSEVLDKYSVSVDNVQALVNLWFKCNGQGFHDSRFDTTAMYVVCNMEREIRTGDYSTGYVSMFKR